MASLTQRDREIFEGKNFAHLVTLMRDGAPQVTPVWVDVEESRILVNTALGRVKERNCRHDPRVALSLPARDNPWDKVDIRGRVVDFIEGEEADRHIDDLSEKYTGKRPYPWRRPGERRVIVVVEPERVYES